VSIAAAWVHPELKDARSSEERFNIVVASTSPSLLNSLPAELSGENMTLDNFHKYFNISVSYHGPAITPRSPSTFSVASPRSSGTPRSAPSKLAISGDPIDPTKMINAFKAGWDFVRDNKAVNNIQQGNYASAYPDGASWHDLAFDHEPTIAPYDGSQMWVKWKNGFGNQCAEIYYRIHWYAHGRYSSDGDGYMDQVTQLVDHAHAAWSVDVNAVSTASRPTNVGTADVPVAAITLNLDMWSGSEHTYNNFVVRGDGTFYSLNPMEVIV